MLDIDRLEAILDHYERRVRSFYRWAAAHGADSELEPLIAVYSDVHAGGNGEILPFCWGDKAGRAWVLAAARTVLMRSSAQAYAIVTEGWMAECTGGPDPGEAGFVMPSQRADRREVLSLIAVARGGAKTARTFTIKRGEAGTVLSLTRHTEDSDYDGELFELFQRPASTRTGASS